MILMEVIKVLAKILTNILTALYEPFGFSLLLSFLAMFFYLYAIEISMRSHSAVTMILQEMDNKNIIISKKERGYHLCPEQKVAKISPKW